MEKNKKKNPRFYLGNQKKILNDTSPFAIKEAYNLVRAKLMFTTKGQKCPVYVVTSAEPSEGKTTNAINLAVSFSMAGKKTLIIDADLRKPAVHKYLKVDRENGLSELLAKIDNKIHVKPTKQENLYILTSGSIPPNPAELMGNSVFHTILKSLSNQFDYIFIDTPPVGVVSDAALLTEYVTGYVMVVRNMTSEMPAVQNAVQTIQNLKGNLAGFLLNDADGKGMEYSKKGYGRYKYDYNYSYGEKQ